ncbi:MAG TPA: DUF494 domain-containing protein [Burkholderiales bacterium]|nr:DUF494 domain-containing protein [Burkholderiales bacterium]
MFEILTYLVHRYWNLGDLPDVDSLSRHLSAAGFDTGVIEEAVDWLSELSTSAQGSRQTSSSAQSGTIRCYAAQEEQKIAQDARGYLYFLESAGVLDRVLREVVLDRITALNDSEIELDQVKLIVLMVLWSHGPRPGHLIFDELFASEDWRSLH